MTFMSPGYLIVLIILLPVLIYNYIKVRSSGNIRFSSLNTVKNLKPSFILKLRHMLIVVRVIILTLLVIGLMRPQKGIDESIIETEGVDIILAIDVSSSMRAEDFIINNQRMNRLEVVKSVVKDFIKKRSNDRIGIVVFAKRAYMQCPVTMDYDIINSFIDMIYIGMIDDGTAVGDGVTAAAARLKNIKSKSKIVILLTDGVSNTGKVSPNNAAELAKAVGIKVYTIGAGSKGKAPFPVQDFFGKTRYQWVAVDIDEKSLKYIARTTGGIYYRADNTEELKRIYNEIDRLEKSKIEIKSYTEYKELFSKYVLIGLLLLLFEIILGYTRLKVLP